MFIYKDKKKELRIDIYYRFFIYIYISKEIEEVIQNNYNNTIRMELQLFNMQLFLFMAVFASSFSTVNAESGNIADTIGTILFVLICVTCVCAGLGWYKRSRG